MLLNGIQPPPVGSVRDVLLTGIYQMDQMQRHYDMSTIGMMLLSAATASIPQNGAQQTASNNLKKVLESHSRSIAFGNWSNLRKNEERHSQDSDAEMLRKVELMRGMNLGK